MQLDIFENIICVHCENNPGSSPKNPYMWNGFFDQDIGTHSCWNCRDEHYKQKHSNPELRGLYSEFPVVFGLQTTI